MKFEYKLIECSHSYFFQVEVNEHLRDGWRLQGGVSVTVCGIGNLETWKYAQAMVRVTG